MSSHRPERLSERIHQEVSVMLAREVSDPRLENLNVTRVDVSGDLRIAKIYVIVHGDEDEIAETMDALKRASGYFRHRLAQNIDLRFAPEIRFYVDRSIEKGEHFLQVLQQVHEEEHAAELSKKTKNGKRK
jgi:ribosome-binding factor A